MQMVARRCLHGIIPSLLLVVVGLTVCSTGVFICQSATIGAIAKSVTEGRSLATGIYYMSYYTGGAAGTWIAGVAYEGWGWSGSVLTIVLAQTLAVVIVALVWQQPAKISS